MQLTTRFLSKISPLGLRSALLAAVVGLLASTSWARSTDLEDGQLSLSTLATPRATVLVTSFRWWTKDENSSVPASLNLRSILESQGIAVHICNVPVLWDLSADRAYDCYQRLGARPNLVVSLGVGPSEHLALGATNLDSSPVKDAHKVSRKARPIDPTLPDYVPFLFSGGSSLSEINARSGSGLAEKINAGGFICNNIAFHLGQTFAEQGIPYFFMHVSKRGKPEQKAMKLSKEQISVLSAQRAAAVVFEVLKTTSN